MHGGSHSTHLYQQAPEKHKGAQALHRPSWDVEQAVWRCRRLEHNIELHLWRVRPGGFGSRGVSLVRSEIPPSTAACNWRWRAARGGHGVRRGSRRRGPRTWTAATPVCGWVGGWAHHRDRAALERVAEAAAGVARHHHRVVALRGRTLGVGTVEDPSVHCRCTASDALEKVIRALGRGRRSGRVERSSGVVRVRDLT